MSSHLRVSGVSKAFAETQALDRVDLEVSPGEIHALLGSNGSGKSTLIKILAGVHAADAGTLEIGGCQLDLTGHSPSDVRAVGLHFVHQESSIFPSLSVAENLELGRDAVRNPLTRVRRSSAHERTKATLERFRVQADPQSPAQELRPAEQTLLAIARILQDDEDASDRILVLDEPTATLETNDVRQLFEALRSYAAAGQAVVFVSHQLDEVIDLADRATVLRDGRNAGSITREDFSEAALGELIVGRPLEAYFPSHPTGRDDTPALEACRVSGPGVDGVDVKVHGGEIVGLAGLVGSGHRELLRLLFGLERLGGGEVMIDGRPVVLDTSQAAIRSGLAYVPADRHGEGIFPELSVSENLGAASLDRHRRAWGVDRAAERLDTARDLDRFGIVASSPAALLSNLSGGNQQKVVVARWLRRNPRVLLLDDPTQGIDIGARADLWRVVDAAVDGGMAVLMTSSDLEELARVCNRVLVFRGGHITHELQSDTVGADDLLELMHAPQSEAAA